MCPPNTIFSEDDGRCIAGDSETCELLPIEELCNGIFFRALPHPTEINLFVGCIQGEPSVMQCDEGEIFNELLGECVQIQS